MFGLILSCGTVVTLMTAGYILQRKGFRGGRKIYATVLGLSALLVFTGAVLALFSGTSLAAEGAAAARGFGRSRTRLHRGGVRHGHRLPWRGTCRRQRRRRGPRTRR